MRQNSNRASEPKLSALHKSILVWLIIETTKIYRSGDEKRINELMQKGVPWSAKKFYDEAFDEALPSNKHGIISRSLKRLAARGLIFRYDSTRKKGKKRNTTHIRLTFGGNYVAADQLSKSEERRHYYFYADRVWTERRLRNG